MTQHGTKISKRFLFVYFMLGGLIFLFTPASVTGKLQLAYARMFSGPLRTGRGVTLASRTTSSADKIDGDSYAELVQKHQIAQNKVADLRAQLDLAETRINDLAKLRTIPDWKRMKLPPASILSDPGQGQNELLINRGRKDGLAIGQFVLGDISVIGTISNVLDHTAKVKLITNSASKIPVRIARIEAQGIMIGSGPNTASIRQVPSREKARKGDRVYALKTPGFPEVPIVTGVVVDCKPDEDPHLWNVTVEPVCDIANLKSVHVIVPSQ